MPINISDFRSQLPGGGARPNLFEVILNNAPDGSLTSLANEAPKFLIKATSLPGTTVTRIDVPYRGRTVRVPGVREFDDTWVTTVINDTDFSVRNWVESWMNSIASHKENVGNFNLTDISADLFVYQLDHYDGKKIRGYKMVDAWPSELNAIELAADTNDSVEEFDITWAYSYWESDDSGDMKNVNGSSKKTTT
jgi:hypothetical protein